MRRRVVITGMGVITPLGHTLTDMFGALVRGKSGVGPISRFDAGKFPTRIAAEVRDYDLGKYVPEPERYKYAGPNTRFALGAARLALDHAGVEGDTRIDRSRFGVYLGSGEGIQDFHVVMSMIARSYRDDIRTVEPRSFTRFAQ